MSCVLVLLVVIDVAVVFLVSLLEVSLIFLLYLRGCGYKEDNQVSYNMILIRTLYLFVNYIYIFMDIIIYVMERQAMLIWNLLDGGPSRRRPLLRYFESMCDVTSGINPHQQPLCVW
jgi:hypothetical protein